MLQLSVCFMIPEHTITELVDTNIVLHPMVSTMVRTSSDWTCDRGSVAPLPR